MREQNAGVKVYGEIVYRRIEDLVPYENNPRVNDRAVSALVEDIPVMGFNVPIVIDKNNVIIKGHSRYEALKRLGYEAAPCIVSDEDEDGVAEDRILDNKVSELSEWDEEKRNCELREMKIDLRQMGVSVPLVRNGVNQVRDVTKNDVEKQQRRLVEDRKTSREKQDLIEVHCDHCKETFFVSLEEVEKYA